MESIVVTSMRQGAGKTSAIIGIAKVLDKKIGYIKPFGDRLLYRKKRLWDYDASLITSIFNLQESAEEMSLGFHHSKLLYMFDEKTTREKLRELRASVGKGRDVVFVESGRDITYGISVGLDALSAARHLDAPLLVVAAGDEDTILDDLTFLVKRIQLDSIELKGVIINKVSNIIDFTDVHLPKIRELGIPLMGVIPFDKELPCLSVNYLADRLFAKVIAGEANMNRAVRRIFIGSMSASTALKSPFFQEENKVVITSGDRGDMIVAALESSTAAIVLTNNLLPSSNLIAQADKAEIPLLLVSLDTYEVAKQIDNMESLPTKDDLEKLERIEQMIRAHLNLDALRHA
jgi:BioD-like phosphotransacetylase family protein